MSEQTNNVKNLRPQTSKFKRPSKQTMQRVAIASAVVATAAVVYVKVRKNVDVSTEFSATVESATA